MELTSFSTSPEEGENQLEESTLQAAKTRAELEKTELSRLESELPTVKSGKIPFEKLPLGCNLIWAGILLLKCLCYGDLIWVLFGDNHEFHILFFGYLAGVLACLIGFSVTAATLFLSIDHEKRLHKLAMNRLLTFCFACFMNSIIAACVSLFFCITGMFVSKDSSMEAIRYLCELGALWSLTLSASYATQSISVVSRIGKKLLKDTEDKVRNTELQRLIKEVNSKKT